jgi:hypothetical protein
VAKALKVYRTAAGFYDAVVAAPSRAAALRAWSSERDLFALGAAEETNDPKLTELALAKPGEVIKVARIDDESYAQPAPKTTKTPPKATKPRPKRTALDRAEADLGAIDAQFAEQRADLERREAELAAERRALIAAEDTARAKAQAAVDRAQAAYDEKLSAWRHSSG